MQFLLDYFAFLVLSLVEGGRPVCRRCLEVGAYLAVVWGEHRVGFMWD